jgi:hypothetical protein
MGAFIAIANLIAAQFIRIPAKGAIVKNPV